MTRGKHFPQDVIDIWPEVFGEVLLNVMPLAYVHVLKITFKNGKIWEIEVKNRLRRLDQRSLELQLSGIIGSYEDDIENIDFKLDTDKIKKDISKSTSKFLKTKKLL